MALATHTIKITADGSGDGTGTIVFADGIITGISLRNNTSNTNTYDVTIAETNGLERTLWTETGVSGTQRDRTIAELLYDNTGTATSQYIPYTLQNASLTVTIANATASDELEVRIQTL